MQKSNVLSCSTSTLHVVDCKFKLTAFALRLFFLSLSSFSLCRADKQGGKQMVDQSSVFSNLQISQFEFCNNCLRAKVMWDLTWNLLFNNDNCGCFGSFPSIIGNKCGKPHTSSFKCLEKHMSICNKQVALYQALKVQPVGFSRIFMFLFFFFL